MLWRRLHRFDDAGVDEGDERAQKQFYDERAPWSPFAGWCSA
ncbi:MAG: hypothetical protein JWR58_5132, partial [Pseudonocardia sp.]|nr:hypothetical protein [Pseudonocardia sp.]